MVSVLLVLSYGVAAFLLALILALIPYWIIRFAVRHGIEDAYRRLNLHTFRPARSGERSPETDNTT